LEQYLVEKDLAMMLRSATKAERGKLYSSTYDELISPQIAQLRPRLTPQTTYLEVGAGDCAL
jgi:hypothetical protein